jgi:hypothetical protein
MDFDHGRPHSLFDRYDEADLSVCGDPLRAYEKYDMRILACLGCFWAIANDSVPSSACSSTS